MKRHGTEGRGSILLGRPARIVALLVASAVFLAGCGGGSGSGSGSTTEYTKVTNDAAGEFAAITNEISSTASGSQADSAAPWDSLAGRVDDLAGKLKATKAPTAEARVPLATLARDVAKLAGDVRAIATAGGANSAGAGKLNGLSDDQGAIQADLQKLPLY